MKNLAITPPEWLCRSSVYQINPRTFSKEGTLKAITAELDFLKKMGFTVIYLCPVFTEDDDTDKSCWSARQKQSGTENPKNPYRISDYFSIDDEYGTTEDLKELIDTAHALDMKVLLDLVYIHIAPNADIIKKHRDFAKQTPDGEIIGTIYNFPSLDFRSEGLREYLYCNMVYYIAVLDADGFRCDVGESVPDDFWREARRRIRTIKEDAILIDEGFTFEKVDSVYDCIYFVNWHEALRKVFCEGESAVGLQNIDEEAKGRLPLGGVVLRDIDNHDTVTDWDGRTEVEAGTDGMEQIIVINYIIDGVPMVYCGNELACKANINMFANRFHPGKYEVTDRTKKDSPEAAKRQTLIKALHKLKNENDILRYGKTRWLESNLPNSVIAFERATKHGRIILVGNASDKPCTAEIQADFSFDEAELLLSNGIDELHGSSIKLSPKGYAVFNL